MAAPEQQVFLVRRDALVQHREQPLRDGLRRAVRPPVPLVESALRAEWVRQASQPQAREAHRQG